MIDALEELPARCVLDNGKESARITPYDLTNARKLTIVRSVAIDFTSMVVNLRTQ